MSRDLYCLLERGYFPKELPQCFHTHLFALQGDALIGSLEPGWADIMASPIKCSIPQKGYGRRFVHVLNPLKYLFVAKNVTDNYATIVKVCNLSPFSESKPKHSYSDLRTRFITASSKSVSSFNDIRLKISLDKEVELKLDLSHFYPSIYTHIIPWALVEKDVAQSIWRARESGQNPTQPQHIIDLYDIGDRLDKDIEKCQDKQTHGIPIGPDASFLIAEAILSRIDSIVKKKYSDIVGVRYYDDYYMYCNSRAEAEEVLKYMISEFNKFGLQVNPAKVAISELPVVLSAEYALKLSPYEFKSNSMSSSIKTYFDVLWSLIKDAPAQTEAIIRYGMKALGEKIARFPIFPKNNDKAILGLLLLKTIITNPIVTPDVLAIANKVGILLDAKLLERTANHILKKHIKFGNHIEILWALWMCKKYKISLDAAILVDAFALNNALVSLMALDYLHNITPALLSDADVDKAIKEISNRMSADSLYSEDWILIYEGSRRGWISGAADVDADSFFSRLKSAGVTFYEENVDVDYRDVNYLLSHKALLPKYVYAEASEKGGKILEKLREKIRSVEVEDEMDELEKIFGNARSHYPTDKEVEDKLKEKNVEVNLFQDILSILMSGTALDEDKLYKKYEEVLSVVKKY